MISNLERTKAPQIFSPITFDFNLLPINNFELNNKTSVYYLNDNKSEIIQLDFVFKAGSIFANNILIASFTNLLLKNGTKNKTSLQIDEILEFYGAFLERNCNTEYASISVKLLNKNLNQILPILKEILTESIFPEEEIELLKNKSKKNLELNLQKGDFVANKKINEFLFGNNHPYGTIIKIEDYDNINRDELIKFYTDFYINGDCKIFVSGCIPNNFNNSLNEYFGNLSFKKIEINTTKYNLTSLNNKHSTITLNNNAVQSSIRIGKIFGNRNNKDFLKARVLNILLGGYFGSRLMEKIREEKGYTYGIYSFIQNNMYDCSWIISTETGKNVCNEAIKCIYEELKKLQQFEIDNEELLLVKNYYLGIILGDIEGVLSIMSIWKSLILNNLDINYFNKNIQEIKNITVEEIKDLAIKYLSPDDFFELVVN